MPIVISGIASLLDYAVLRDPGFGRPAQLHNEGAIPSVVDATVLSLLNTSRSDYASPVTNDTMLMEDRTAKREMSAITQLQFQAIEYVGSLVWIVQGAGLTTPA